MMNTKVILGNMLLLCLQLVNLVLTPFVLSGSDSFFLFFFDSHYVCLIYASTFCNVCLFVYLLVGSFS